MAYIGSSTGQCYITKSSTMKGFCTICETTCLCTILEFSNYMGGPTAFFVKECGNCGAKKKIFEEMLTKKDRNIRIIFAEIKHAPGHSPGHQIVTAHVALEDSDCLLYKMVRYSVWEGRHCVGNMNVSNGLHFGHEDAMLVGNRLKALFAATTEEEPDDSSNS